jgi:hypothetical protein
LVIEPEAIMRQFQLNESTAARRDLFVQMVDANDYVTPLTGLSLTVEIVKAGQANYVAIAGGSDELGHGTYRISLAAADLDTQGEAMLRVTGAGAADQFVPLQVVRLFDEVHLAKAALVNCRRHVIDTGVNEIRDDDGEATLRTMTPSEEDGVITISPS